MSNLKLINTKHDEENQYLTYEGVGYTVYFAKSLKGKYRSVSVINNKGYSEILVYNHDGEFEVKLMTSGIGALTIDEMKEFVEKYNNAIIYAKEIEELINNTFK